MKDETGMAERFYKILEVLSRLNNTQKIEVLLRLIEHIRRYRQVDDCE